MGVAWQHIELGACLTHCQWLLLIMYMCDSQFAHTWAPKLLLGSVVSIATHVGRGCCIKVNQMAGAKLVAPWGRNSYMDTIVNIESSANMIVRRSL